jgi:ABC-type uncharacterized transport system permease subunit
VAWVGGNVWDVSAPLATGVDAVRRTTSPATPLITALLVGFVLATALAMDTHNARSADALAGLGVMAVGLAALPGRAERGGRAATRPGTSGPG